jgi:hypothetical protein
MPHDHTIALTPTTTSPWGLVMAFGAFGVYYLLVVIVPGAPILLRLLVLILGGSLVTMAVALGHSSVRHYFRLHCPGLRRAGRGGELLLHQSPLHPLRARPGVVSRGR